MTLNILLILFFAGLFFPAGCEHKAKNNSGRKIISEIPDFASEAIVVLAYLGRHQRGATIKSPRVAFAIGDGTLILTAAHCVQDFGEPRKQAVSPDIVVISPYYGDVFDFEILALDKEADLAVLRASWPAHPALALASQQDLETAKQIIIASRPCRPSDKQKKPPYRLSRQIRAEKLAVLRLNEKMPNEAILLKGTRFVVPGWSGSALVLPKTGKVVGVLGRLMKATTIDGAFVRKDAAGCGIGSIKALLTKNNLQSQAQAHPPQLQPVEDANQAFDLAIDYVESLFNSDLAEAVDIAKQLVALRPQSVQARLFLAFSAHQEYAVRSSSKEMLALAESNFKQALTLDPDNASAHAGYGNFLMERKRYEQALKETEAALAIQPDNELALANRVHILTQTDPLKAEEYSRQLVEKDPNNSHWWYWYHRALMTLDRYEEALEAVQKAVDLNPNGFYYGGLANALAKLDRLDDAEPYYKRMTKDCGCQLCWFKYADFLIDHRPDKLDEAEKALDLAESKTAKRVSQQSLRNQRTNLNLARLRPLEKESPKKAEILVRKLLKDSPENGHYQFALAGILRTRGRHEEAVQAARQAVRLCPDRSYRPRLANCLTKAGRLDEAQQIYNQILQDHPDRQKYWFWYANFLCEHFPNRIEEAHKALSRAKTPGTDWSVSPEELRELREKIDAKADALQKHRK